MCFVRNDVISVHSSISFEVYRGLKTVPVSSQDSDYYYDEEDEDFEEWGSEVSSSSPREEASAHSLKDVPRRGRPPRRAALQRRATHPGPETTDRSTPRRTTRSVSYSQNQTAKNTHTKVKHLRRPFV